MITREGRVKIMDNMKSTFTKYKVGSGGDSTNPNAGDLDSPLGSVGSVSPTAVGISTLEFNFSINGSDFLGHTIKEVGIFDSAGTEMLIRTNYDGFGPLTSTDVVQFIITVEVD